LFGGELKLPEWWHNTDKQRSDIQINCAAQSSPRYTHNKAHTVSLAGINYYVSGDIDLGGTYTDLIGAGGNATSIITTPSWRPAQWNTCHEWPQVEGGNHAAVISIGSKRPETNASFHNKVAGMSVSCYEAQVANHPRRISAISTNGWVEECTELHDLQLGWAGGAGIAFPPQNGAVCVLNGVTISSVWITGAMYRDSYGILFSGHSDNWVVDGATIDMTLPKEVSAEYAPFNTPRFISDWPRMAVKAMGHGEIKRLHVESCGAAVGIAQGYGISAIKISGLKTARMMDAAAGQIWTHDGRNRITPAPDGAGIWDYSTAVVLYSIDWDLTCNYKDRVVLENIVSLNRTSRLLVDRANMLCVSAYGQGQYKDQATGGITQWIRGNAWDMPGNYTLVR
jgi:hypothetical protein